MKYSLNLERRAVWLAALIQLVNAVDFMIIMPLGADLSRNLNISAAWIGYLGGSYTLAAAISSFLIAKHIDKYDRKSVAIFSLFGLSVATLFCANAWNMESLLFARILAGIFAGPSGSIALAIVSDCVPVGRRGKAMAIVMGAFSIAAIAGVPLGVKLAEKYGWASPFYVVSMSAFIVVLLIVSLLPKLVTHIPENLVNQKDLSVANLLALRVFAWND